MLSAREIRVAGRAAWALLAAIGCAGASKGATEAPACATPPIEMPSDSEVDSCKRAGGTMTEYSSTCGDACETLLQPVCGTAFTVQCDCGPGRCFSGWECVPDACAELYTREALDAQAVAPRRAEVERIEARLGALRALPIEREPAAMDALRAWLASTYPRVRLYADEQDGPLLAPEISTSPRTVVIEVWLYGETHYLPFTPRAHASFLRAIAP